MMENPNWIAKVQSAIAISNTDEACGEVDAMSGACCTIRGTLHQAHQDASDPGCVLTWPR